MFDSVGMTYTYKIQYLYVRFLVSVSVQFVIEIQSSWPTLK